MATRLILKRGSLGDVVRESGEGSIVTIREFGPSRWPWLARRLARREAEALKRLSGIAGIPALIDLDRNRLIRTFVPGSVMHEGEAPTRACFRNALRLVRLMHQRRVAHNDLAKEANWICGDGDVAGIVDFQLAICFGRRTRLFRSLAREDLRHLLKHKRHYRPEDLTNRQRAILANPSWRARTWSRIVKPAYVLLTRRLLGWPERVGAAERQRAK